MIGLVDIGFKAWASSNIWGGINTPEMVVTGTKDE